MDSRFLVSVNLPEMEDFYFFFSLLDVRPFSLSSNLGVLFVPNVCLKTSRMGLCPRRLEILKISYGRSYDIKNKWISAFAPLDAFY